MRRDQQTAIGVVRVSGARQAGPDHFSLDSQARAIREFCDHEGIALFGIYEEPGTSVFTPDLASIPELYRALLEIEAGHANVLIIHESSRLARNERLLNEIADRLDAVGGRLIDLSMSGVDFSTPEGRMILGQNGNLNAYFSRKISQHSRKGKEEQFRRGLPVGQIPFGYRKGALDIDGVPTPSRAVPPVSVPDEARAITKAFEDYILGKGSAAIAREWNALGLRPRSVRGIDRFQNQTVRGILSNRFYAGYVSHKGVTRPGLHEPLVDEETFERAQRPRQQQKGKRRHPPALLAGSAKCAACGGSIYGHRVRHGRDRERFNNYYRESSRDYSRECSDAGLLWPMAEVDEQVANLVRELGLDQDWLQTVEREARSAPCGDTETERERLRAMLNRLQREYLRGRLPENDYEAQRAEYEHEMVLLPVPLNAMRVAAEDLSSFAQLWDAGSPETRNETCRTLFEHVVLDLRNRTIEVRPWADFAPLFQLRASVYVGAIRPGQGSPRCGC